MFDAGQFARRRQDAHVVQFLQKRILVFPPNGALGGHTTKTVRELSNLSAQPVVLVVVFGFLDRVSPDDGGIAVVIVLFVG